MPARSHPRRLAAITVLASLVLIAGACTPRPGASGAAGPSVRPDGPSIAGLTPLKVGLGYLPSVQFAPFYLALQAGYYTDAGLEVTFENKIDPDLVTLVGQGALDLGVADGTSVIPAVSNGIPIRYIATVYGTYPSIVFTKAGSGITSPSDLRAKKIGIPGRFGSSWIMLQALLDSAGLTPQDVTIVEYPDFGQGIALQQGAVAAATGFANNEPVQLELEGIDTFVMHVDDIVDLPGPGLIAGTALLDAEHAAVAAFVAATLRAMDDIAAEPDLGLDAAIAAVPELGLEREKQSAILAATIEIWNTGAGRFGAIERTGWEASIAYLTELGLVPNPVTVDDLVRDELLPAASAGA
jgi:NitT/TauT family transport system substrate-binding protein